MGTWFGNPEHDELPPSYNAALSDLRTQPRRVSIVNPKSFEETQGVADSFKRRHLVIVNLRNVEGNLSKRIIDFCAGLTYALGGQVQPIVDRLFLLTPHDVEVLDEEGELLAERVFFNQL